MRLPPRFVAEFLPKQLSAWVGPEVLGDLIEIYVTGRGANWQEAMPLLQAQLGLPLKLAERYWPDTSEAPSGASSKDGLAGLNYLSLQVQR